MPKYEHECRNCGIVWYEEYHVGDPPPTACLECGSLDIYRCVNAPPFHLRGAGWAADGYHKEAPLESWKGRMKTYDTKEDYVREAVGEAKQRKKNMLKAQNEVIKRTLGPDAAITEREAERKIEGAAKKARDEV